MYNTLNNPSAHPSYSHYYLLSPSTLFFLFLYILLFFAHLVVFLHIFFAHLIVFCTSYCFLHIVLFCTFFYFIAHFTLISPFLTICMPLCYVTLYNLYSYYFALSTERTWFDYISLLIIPCITIMWQIKKPWTLKPWTLMMTVTFNVASWHVTTNLYTLRFNPYYTSRFLTNFEQQILFKAVSCSSRLHLSD